MYMLRSRARATVYALVGMIKKSSYRALYCIYSASSGAFGGVLLT